MAELTGIEWTDHSWSPWWGCVEVSPACDHCYARQLANRYGHAVWGPDAPRRELSAAHWQQPYQWDRAAALAGVRRRVFPSMCDPFEFRPNDGGVLDRLRGDLWCVIEGTPNLDWLLLTKRPGNCLRMFPERWDAGLPANLAIGVTVENRGCLHRVNTLLNVPTPRRFLSIEPLLEDLGQLDLAGIAWIIVGGESGPGARPMHPDWARRIRDQCQAAGMPFFFKQWGEWCPATEEYGVVGSVMPETGCKFTWIGGDGLTQNPSSHGLLDPVMAIAKLGKRNTGRVLDGREWSEFPAWA